MTYAETTSVSAEKSRNEIERLLQRYGATGFLYGWNANNSAAIGFRYNNRHIRFELIMPDPNDPRFKNTPGRKLARKPEQQLAAWEQATRQRWRALALVIKAKLEAVQAGITTFENEFLAHTMLPNGETVGEWIEPQIETAYSQGKMPVLLLECRGRWR